MKRAAFTFVEILVALAFIGVLLPAIVSGLRLANRASVVAERSTVAAQLAENQLAELLIGNAWTSGQSRGDFGADHPGYTWQLTQRDWQSGSMAELTMEVHFQVQGQDSSVKLTTLADDTATSSSTSTSTAGSSTP